MSGGRRVEEREGEGGGENITASCVKRSTVDGHGRDVASLAEQTDGEMASERLRPGGLAGQLLINHFPSAVVPSNHQSIPSSLPFMQTKDELVVVGGGALFKILTMLPPSLPHSSHLWSSSAQQPPPPLSSPCVQRGFLCQGNRLKVRAGGGRFFRFHLRPTLE